MPGSRADHNKQAERLNRQDTHLLGPLDCHRPNGGLIRLSPSLRRREMEMSQDQHDAGGSHTRRGNTESVAQDVRRAAEAAKRQSAEAFSQVSEQAARYADREKEAVGEHLQEFARAVRHAGDELGRRDQTMASQLVREAASG